MIILTNDKLIHVDSSTDILEHYGVKGMKWSKHRSNMRTAKDNKKAARRSLNEEDFSLRTGYGILNALGEEANHVKGRNADFRLLSKRKANNDVSVKRQKYIDKYSTDNTIKGLNAKGKRKNSKLNKKVNKLSDKYYNDIESRYQRTKGNYIISI